MKQSTNKKITPPHTHTPTPNSKHNVLFGCVAVFNLLKTPPQETNKQIKQNKTKQNKKKKKKQNKQRKKRKTKTKQNKTKVLTVFCVWGVWVCVWGWFVLF